MSQTVENVSESFKKFGSIDYAVFILMLIISALIGLYFGYKDHQKQKFNRFKSRRGSVELEYLLGGKNVQVFPVAMSLVATFVSGITLLGTSTEIYIYGIQYAYVMAGPLFLGIYMHYIIIPVFYELKVVSMFEYLERRFDMKLRLFGSVVLSVSTITWLPIVVYVPALAFNQTTGVDIHIITPVVMSVCIFYTLLGGIKAVIWTDVIQIVIMYIVMVLVMIKGTANIGGLSALIDINMEGDRFETPDFRIDPTIRHTFWSLFVGGGWYWIICNTNQSVIQRFLALKDEKTAKKGCKIYVIAITILIFMCIYNGLLLYATYHDCDPLTTKLAKANDQLVPLLVMQILKDIPGLPGLFIAGVFSAALSTLSSNLNSMAAVALEDYFKPVFKNKISETMSGFVMRGTVLIIGVLSVALVYVVQHLGSVLELSMRLPAACVGGMFGIFTIGMFLPWIGKRATFYGALVSSAVMTYIVVRSQLDLARGVIGYETKSTSVEGCQYNFTLIENLSKPIHDDEIAGQFHHMSYLYYMPFGAMIGIVSSVILSMFFGFEDPNNVDSKLLAPMVRKYFQSNNKKSVTKHNEEKEMITIKFEDMKNQME
ncbi:CLUMA_CG015346, isoform A [Clunio marinus]|uniref:CLUMA_CG015346, isoform A n=1 Tax=Clunio marinus TaxID=568069 RepID=A0A1J1IUL3_9DIPT|nr:CLUMA_CG015346, isoform A [Clunio marinus]